MSDVELLLDEPGNDENEVEPLKVQSSQKKGRSRKNKKEDHYSEYSRENVLIFIEQIKENEVIWDPSNSNYHRREFRVKVFDKVELFCSKFMPRGRTFGKVAEERWKELVADYKKHETRIQNAPSGSGISATKKTFEYADEMEFYKEALSKRAVKNAYVIGCDENTVFETPKRSFSKEETDVKVSKRRRDVFDFFSEQLSENTKAIMKAVNGEEESTGCSDGICEVFQEHVKNWPKVEKLKASAEVISFIQSLSIGSKPHMGRQSFNFAPPPPPHSVIYPFHAPQYTTDIRPTTSGSQAHPQHPDPTYYQFSSFPPYNSNDF